MELQVELGGAAIGTLRATEQGLVTFRFGEHYLDASDRPTLGQEFEDNLRRTWRASQRLPEFFSNLLPEGALRQLVAKQMGVAEHREVLLLVRLGDDLPGAVSVSPLTEIDESEVPSAAIERGPAPEAPLRFSLAGVQTKFSVLREADKFVFPARGMGGDWIVKLPDREYAHVPENEFSMMTWAKRAGIDVPEFELVETTRLANLPEAITEGRHDLSYAVRRFDREGDRRIHIEDFAQVLGVYPEAKYDHFNYESIANVVAEACGEASLRECLRRLAFMVVSGNADMHLKNWSLRYSDGRTPALSPAYDFVATVAYPEVKRELALKFSKSQNFDAVNVGHFQRLARRLGRDPRSVEAWLQEDLDRMVTAWAELRDQLPLPTTQRDALEAHMQRLALLRGSWP
jgi:serine/threonine-protein kinase HipA